MGSVPLTTNLDAWDGMGWRHQAPGCHLGLGRLDDGRYYACYASDWPEGIIRRKQNDGTYEILYLEHNGEIYENMFEGYDPTLAVTRHLKPATNQHLKTGQLETY